MLGSSVRDINLLSFMQVAGTLQVSEFSLDNDKDDYVIAVRLDKEDEKYSCLSEAIKGLQPTLKDLLAQFDHDIKALQQ